MKLSYLKLTLTGLLMSLFIISCDNSDDPIAVDDEAVIQQYIQDNGINAVKSEEWDVYYTEITPGNGTTVSSSDVVEISYQNALLDGSVFMTDTSYTFVPEVYAYMSGLIRSTLTMTEGGQSTFIIPSVYAYGSNYGTLNDVYIEANSVITSNITLKAVRNRTEQLAHEIELIRDYMTGLGYEGSEPNIDGLFKEIITEGDGESPQTGAQVLVEYEGSFLDGSVFNETTETTFTLSASGLIQGFYDAVLTMKVGEEAIFAMPSTLGYGDTGPSSGTIDPFTPLVFKIKLIEI
ncbi:FKBP-type peptidyl-prolyl cis-trans isomerase [Chondrinema litorale]|uniref:FKBP-type peptidyl-prolyl cis-trans isomerase n=1 Tax=Chondrinema litorale TaxID=2994555 RepID=UPI002542A008|nr:FKBP-type peptidyl-prolyl cis-trans isomerase [Chondrinema litorale]UZR93249.1 FKBP-type peptidyl-prolyl cis-trans isomerase [Chondrinema litorale]